MDGVPEPKPATLVAATTPLRLVEPPRYVSRGGLKLEEAIRVFGIDVAGKRALDAGASTGGFTDCLLKAGAASVVTVDVGYGQLDWSLRTDDRVTVIERTNLRHADPASIGAPFDIVVADLSFISLVTVAPALLSMGGERSDYVLLVKPQFEVGPELIGKGGVIRDPDVHFLALRRVVAGLAAAGLGAVRVRRSPITGATGNREFLLLARWGPAALGDSQLAEAAES